MSSVRDLTAADIIDDEPVTVNVGQTLSKARAIMEEHDLRTVAVVDGARFVGILSYRDLMEKLRSNPATTKVDDLVHAPPRIKTEQNLVDLAVLRIDSGRKKFAMVGEHDRLEGVVGERDLVHPARDTDELSLVTVQEIMTADLITVAETESFDAARRKMRDHNISRLPVVDDAGELVGVITSQDILGAMVPREQMEGGSRNQTAGHQASSGPVSAGDVKGEKESFSDIPVEALMDHYDVQIPVLEDDTIRLPAAIDLLRDASSRELVVVADGKPVGMLTLKDVIDVVAREEAVDSLLVKLTGPEVPEEKEAIHDKVETAVQGGLGRVLQRPEELRIHVKKYEEDGARHKYSLKFMLSSAEGTTNVKTHDWNLLDAVDEGLEKLETVLKKQKQKRIDERRQRERKGKYSGA